MARRAAAPIALADKVIVAKWAQEVDELPRSAALPRRLIDQAVASGRDLTAGTATTSVLLHGDLHYGSVLAADREPWLAILPRPANGDPHAELAPMLLHRADDLAGRLRDGVRARFYALVDAAGLDDGTGPRLDLRSGGPRRDPRDRRRRRPDPLRRDRQGAAGLSARSLRIGCQRPHLAIVFHRPPEVRPIERSGMKTSRLLAAAASTFVVIGLVACAPPEKETPKTQSGVNANAATSAADFGGMDGLVKAAKDEGALNVIALPPDWANYKEIIDTFSSKYGIKVNSAQPDANSQDEINAANQQKGKSTAPDVFDLGQAIALANTSMFAPYKVSTFDDIPASFKDPNGTWVNDYGGYMSIGYDSAKLPAVTGVNDLLRPEFKGQVALNGDPTTASAAASGVLMARDRQRRAGRRRRPRRRLLRTAQGRRQLPAGRPDAGDDRVRADAGRHRLGLPQRRPRRRSCRAGRSSSRSNAVVGGYYFQAINKDAPHPAAARLWQEFLYSDEGQNLFLKGLARPVRADAMEKAGTVDKALLAALPPVQGTPVVPTDAQSKKNSDYLGANWAKAIG